MYILLIACRRYFRAGLGFTAEEKGEADKWALHPTLGLAGVVRMSLYDTMWSWPLGVPQWVRSVSALASQEIIGSILTLFRESQYNMLMEKFYFWSARVCLIPWSLKVLLHIHGLSLACILMTVPVCLLPVWNGVSSWWLWLPATVCCKRHLFSVD